MMNLETIMGRYPSHIRPIQYINNTPYLVHAVYPIVQVRDAKMVKEWLGVDTAFKDNRQGKYIFCELIEEINWENV